MVPIRLCNSEAATEAVIGRCGELQVSAGEPHPPSNTLPLLYSCDSVPIDMIWGMAQNLKMSRLCRPCMNLWQRQGRT